MENAALHDDAVGRGKHRGELCFCKHKLMVGVKPFLVGSCDNPFFCNAVNLRDCFLGIERSVKMLYNFGADSNLEAGGGKRKMKNISLQELALESDTAKILLCASLDVRRVLCPNDNGLIAPAAKRNAVFLATDKTAEYGMTLLLDGRVEGCLVILKIPVNAIVRRV